MFGLDKLTFISPERRQALQLLFVLIVGGLVTTGVISTEQQQHVFILIAALVQLVAAVINLKNLDPKAAATLFVSGLRKFIYTAAPLIAAAAAALGFIAESDVAIILTWVSFGFTALGAIIAIVFAVPVTPLLPDAEDEPTRK